MRSSVIGVIASILTVALSGCAPQAEFDPVAVRPSLSGAPEILYTSCSPVLVHVVEVVALEDNWDDKTQRVWKIEFPGGSNLRSFVAGSTPEGAIERIHWQVPDEKRRPLAARLVLEGNLGVFEGFEIGKLKVGEVVFHERSISDDEFARASACG